MDNFSIRDPSSGRTFAYLKPNSVASGTPFGIQWILPAGTWFRVMAVTFNVNAAGGAGNFQCEVNCSKSGDIYWQATQAAPVATGAYNGGVSFSRQANAVSDVGVNRVQQALPDVWVPGESVVNATDLIAGDPIQIGLPMMILESRVFRPPT